MPKYLFRVSYTAEGAKGVPKDGGSKGQAPAVQAAKAVGAKIEQFYFAFGDTDVFVILDAPDLASSPPCCRRWTIRATSLFLQRTDQTTWFSRYRQSTRPSGADCDAADA